MRRTLYQETPFGWLAFCIQNEVLQTVHWVEPPEFVSAEPELMTYVEHLLKGESTLSPWPLAIRGTTFQQKVWMTLTTIPFGETRTYSEVAKQVGSPRASQAVGQACRRNPFPLVIPCHRVITASQGIGGYCGVAQSARKIRLLAHEKKSVEFYRSC